MNTSNVSFSKCFFSLRQVFVKPGLLSSRFFISMICIFNFPNDWNEFVFEVHGCNSQESLFYILASILQILHRRADDLFVPQELSRNIFRFRVWIELHFLLELLDVPRKCLLCRIVILDSTFFCVRTLLQVSLHFLGSEMKLTMSVL